MNRGHDMSTNTIPPDKLALMKHTLAAYYVLGAIFVMAPLLGLEFLQLEWRVLSAVPFVGVFFYMASRIYRGRLAPDSIGDFVFALVIHSAIIFGSYAFSLKASQMLTDTHSETVKEQAASCMQFGEEFFAKNPGLQELCRAYRKPK